MRDLIWTPPSAAALGEVAQRLRQRALSEPISVSRVMDVLERWGSALNAPTLAAVPGVAFLRLWLRRGTLEPIVVRELGQELLTADGWRQERPARLGTFPVGLVGHWPAGNVEIQPLLSLTCALLGGNGCLVRVPQGLVEITRQLLEPLAAADTDALLTQRICMLSFEHERLDLQRAMAANVDGAMIWGGAEAVSQIRALPFPHWAHLAVFGPRLSIAAMDEHTWSNVSTQSAWCQRIARDVWQFDQQACSSPQSLFLEQRTGSDLEGFLQALRTAFEAENRAHPRREIDPSLSSAICLERASWILKDPKHRAWFPPGPDWTILLGSGAVIPAPTQGRTLTVLAVDDLLDPIKRFGGAVQTLGLAMKDADRESIVSSAAARNGVDRIVKLGRMHVFGSPWDGVDLVRPMTRLVRHVPSQEILNLH